MWSSTKAQFDVFYQGSHPGSLLLLDFDWVVDVEGLEMYVSM